MAKIWSDENRYNCWLEVEILADEKLGQIREKSPREDVEKFVKMQNSLLNVFWKLKKKLDMTSLRLRDVSLKVLEKKRNGFITD